jgi:hypothetical protein
MVRADERFKEYYDGNKVLKLWSMLRDLCTKDAMQDLGVVKYALWNTKKGKRSFEEYVLEIEQLLKSLSCGNVVMTEEDQVIIFVQGLDRTRYGEFVANIKVKKGTEGYPDT